MENNNQASKNDFQFSSEVMSEVLNYFLKKGGISNLMIKDNFSLIPDNFDDIDIRLNKAKATVKELITSNLGKAIENLKSSLDPNCDHFDQLITLNWVYMLPFTIGYLIFLPSLIFTFDII